MKHTNGLLATLLLLTTLLASCATTGGGSGEAAPDGMQGLRRALAESTRQPGSWSRLHLVVECFDKDARRSLEVFGSGVAVWNNQRQFRLPVSDVSHLLGLLEKADFVGMEKQYGGRKSSGLEKPKPRGATVVTCQVRLNLDGLMKGSAQLLKGDQSEALKALAKDILDFRQEKGEQGVTAADLREGLEKLSAGELAPDVLTLILHRKPERPSTTTEGFLFRLSGSRVTTRTFDSSEGYSETKEAELTPAEFEELARVLANADPASLPDNLWADSYTDLSIELLDKKKSIQARQFARLTPSTHGKLQLDFNSIYNSLYAIHQRVLEVDREAGDGG